MVRRWLSVLCLALLAPALAADKAQAPVVVLSIDGAVTPSSADYVHRGLEHAALQGAQLVVLRMDTPGGLDTSMRAIIKDILASPIPVAAFVAPSGARAASAGTYILYASHVAAMAPGTNLGAATPVQLGGPAPAMPGKEAPKDDKEKEKGKGAAKAEEPEPAGALARKQIHDAAAYIRSLAAMRGRNAEWGERAVREAVSLTANEALEQKVVDIIAADVPQLAEKLDGRKVIIAAGERTLTTKGAPVIAWDPDWRANFLAVITNPSIAYILLLVGLYALVFELANPGLVLPGVAGAICILIGLYALHLLPVNYAGLALIVVGIGFMIAEAFLPAYGSLGIGGFIAFVIGSVILIDVPGFGVPYALIGGFAVATGLFLAVVLTVLMKARRRPVVSGAEELIGASGEVLEASGEEGWARVHSETWKVRSRAPLRAGQEVRVIAIDGLVLNVEPSPRPQGA